MKVSDYGVWYSFSSYVPTTAMPSFDKGTHVFRSPSLASVYDYIVANGIGGGNIGIFNNGCLISYLFDFTVFDGGLSGKVSFPMYFKNSGMFDKMKSEVNLVPLYSAGSRLAAITMIYKK